MFVAKQSVSQTRQLFRKQLSDGNLLRFPGAFSPLVARLIEEIGFEGVYISGAALSADLGMPDIGLTTLSEVAQRASGIAQMTNLPVLVDADTGFGETANVSRTIRTLENAGLCGCHLEDQLFPKRCGHLDHKQLIPSEQMIQKIKAAVASKQDPNFVIAARTDARGVDGMDEAIKRAKSYVDAGADMIFPEALTSPEEFEAFRSAVDIPLLANMTEFGKSPLLSFDQLASLGYNMVIYPVTSLRLAMRAVEDGLREIAQKGSQSSLVEKMQTRQQLYELLGYDTYLQQDRHYANRESQEDEP